METLESSLLSSFTCRPIVDLSIWILCVTLRMLIVSACTLVIFIFRVNVDIVSILFIATLFLCTEVRNGLFRFLPRYAMHPGY